MTIGITIKNATLSTITLDAKEGKKKKIKIKKSIFQFERQSHFH